MNKTTGEKIGLLPGSGDLPIIFTQKTKNKIQLVITGIISITPHKLEKMGSSFKWFSMENIDRCLDFFYEQGAFKIVVLGKFDKTPIFKSPDALASFKRILLKLKDGRDLSFFELLCQEAEKRGLEVIEPSFYLPELLIKEEKLTEFSLTPQQLRDVKFGWEVAKKISSLDIGQTVVIKNLTVLAIEAIEGTDKAILRGGSLGGDGSVVVKVARPDQDMRFDIPVVGPKTLMNMVRVKSKVLALEKGKVFVIHKSKVIQIAKKNKISILGIGGQDE